MVQTGDGPRAASRPPWSERLSSPVLVTAVVAVVGVVVRRWIRTGNAPLMWNDSADYLASAATPVFSTARWLGARPPLMPDVLSLVHSHLRTFVTFQTGVAAISWGLLAGAVAATLGAGWRRWVAALVVFVLSLPWQVSMWDQQVLTESLALSSLALLSAALVNAARGLDRTRAVLLVLAAIPALAVRDTHVVPIALGALGLGAWELVRLRRDRDATPRWPVLLAAGYLVALSVLAAGAAQWGHRQRVPLEHVYAVRILPYPDRVDWFSAHGMPEGDAFKALPPVLTPGKADYIGISPLPAWEDWRIWLGRHGRSTLVAYMATHPAYLFAEPEKQPERVFNNGDGLATYRPLKISQVPGAEALGYVDPLVAIAILMPAMVLASWRRVLRSPAPVAGLILVVTSIPHALVAWHSDGMESARHLLIPATQFRMGVALVVLGAVLAPRGAEPKPVPRKRPPAHAKQARPAQPSTRQGPRPAPRPSAAPPA